MSKFRKAERRKAKLRLAITGSAGSGQTYGALLVVQGLGGRIAIIDTESDSGDLYSAVCEYDIMNINAHFALASTFRLSMRLKMKATMSLSSTVSHTAGCLHKKQN